MPSHLFKLSEGSCPQGPPRDPDGQRINKPCAVLKVASSDQLSQARRIPLHRSVTLGGRCRRGLTGESRCGSWGQPGLQSAGVPTGSGGATLRGGRDWQSCPNLPQISCKAASVVATASRQGMLAPSRRGRQITSITSELTGSSLLCCSPLKIPPGFLRQWMHSFSTIPREAAPSQGADETSS